MGMTVAQANEVLSSIIGDGVYVSLHTAHPEETGAAEVAGGGYRRLEAAFGDPVEGAASSLAALEFELLPRVVVTHISLWDRSREGFLRWSSPLEAPTPVRDRGTFRIAAGDLRIQLRGNS